VLSIAFLGAMELFEKKRISQVELKKVELYFFLIKIEKSTKIIGL
jgi:hypothetical protein